MIIDLILDRRDAGIEYSPKKFYGEIGIFPLIAWKEPCNIPDSIL